jgi:hypothetical protein
MHTSKIWNWFFPDERNLLLGVAAFIIAVFAFVHWVK